MKRKIVHIVRSPAGGIRKHIVSIIEKLDSDFEMYLILDSSKGDKSYFEFLDNNEHIQGRILDLKILEQPGFIDIINLYKILMFVLQLSPHAIHGHGAKGGVYARVIGFFLNIKVIYTAHGGSIHNMHGRTKNRLYSFLERVMYYFTDLLVFESKYSMEQYSKKISVDSSNPKFRLNYNAVPYRELPSTCREMGEEVIIGAFGLLRFIKGHDLLVSAVSNIIKRGYKIRLRIFGHGEEKQNLLQLAERKQILKSFEILEETRRVDEEMRKCHLIAHPSRFESFGYVPLEALVNGVTVVSSLSGGLREVMDNGKSGFCFETLDVESLESAIENALTSRSLREKKYLNAKKEIERKFSMDRFSSGLRDIYLSLM